MPYGTARLTSGTLPTDKLFTGQRRDIATAGSELYYYHSWSPVTSPINPSKVAKSPLTVTMLWGGRYYDPSLGRFISPDTIVSKPFNPQELNRYSYCLNNPLRYVDPTGHQEEPNTTPTEGQFKWTSADGGQWSIYSGGQWNKITEEAVNELSYAFQRSTSATWQGFLNNIGLNVNAEEYYWRKQTSDLGCYRLYSYAGEPEIPPGCVTGPVHYQFDVYKPLTRHDIANTIRDMATGIDTIGAGATNIPPEDMIAGCGLLGLADIPAGIAALAFYGVFLFGPGILDKFADRIDR